jgi:hypothetical protein
VGAAPVLSVERFFARPGLHALARAGRTPTNALNNPKPAKRHWPAAGPAPRAVVTRS